MNKGNSTITVIVAVALAFVVALGVISLGPTHKGEKGDRGVPGSTITGPQGPKGDNGEIDLSLLENLQSVLRNLSNVVGKLPTKLGATPGDDHYGAYWGVNDVKTYYTKISSLVTATNTPCIISSPSDATTTLVYGSYALNTATSATMFIDFGHGIATSRGGGGGFATSSTGEARLGGQLTIAANAKANFTASSTLPSTQADQNANVFGPGDFFIVKSYGGANNGYYNHTGTCEAVFTVF